MIIEGSVYCCLTAQQREFSRTILAATKWALVTETIPFWQTDHAYGVGEMVYRGRNYYVCLESHTSATSLPPTSPPANGCAQSARYCPRMGHRAELRGGQDRQPVDQLPHLCALAHTSGTFAADLAAGKWVMLPVCAVDGEPPIWHLERKHPVPPGTIRHLRRSLLCLRGNSYEHGQSSFAASPSRNDWLHYRSRQPASRRSLPADWETGFAYCARDLVIHGGDTYYCWTSHTAGTFATDLAGGKWMLLEGLPSKQTGRPQPAMS